MREATAQTTKASFDLFEIHLREAKHPKSRAAIERIREACDYLAKHSIPISIKEVAQLCTKSGPKAQSIRNNGRFVQYISSRKAEQELQAQPVRSDKGRYRSTDVHANALLYASEAQLAAKDAQISALSRALRELGVYDVEAVIRTGRLELRTSPHVPLLELRAVASRVLNPVHLRNFGLVLQQARIVAPDRNDRVFLEK
jgi:hypothetical protein